MNVINRQDVVIPFKIPNKNGYNVEFNKRINGYEIAVPNGNLIFIEHFFNASESKKYLEELTANQNNFTIHSPVWDFMDNTQLSNIEFNNIQWRQDIIKLFGKKIAIPRFSAWYGSEGIAYTYSGLTLHSKPWNECLLAIKSKIESTVDQAFNSVLLNWYRNGNDSMSWHADDEKELGENPVIASVNFGATRRFDLRSNLNKENKISIYLNDGSLLLMRGALQHFWQHSIPKTKKVKSARINLTFRSIIET